MPVGIRPRDPSTPYRVYEFAYGPKVFYVGIAYTDLRARGRWAHIANLLRHQEANTLKPIKGKALATKSNTVIASLIRLGRPEFEVLETWSGLGKVAAEAQEKLTIQDCLNQGCLLANNQHCPVQSTADEIVRWLVAD